MFIVHRLGKMRHRLVIGTDKLLILTGVPKFCHIVVAVGGVSFRIVAKGDVVLAGRAVKKGKVANGQVDVAARIIGQRRITDGRIVASTPVVTQR